MNEACPIIIHKPQMFFTAEEVSFLKYWISILTHQLAQSVRNFPPLIQSLVQKLLNVPTTLKLKKGH